MDSAEDPFTRRMLQRAASMRKNRGGSLRRSFEDPGRRMSILRAILTDEPLKTEDLADCRTDDSKRDGSSGVNTFAEFDGGSNCNQRRRSIATDRSLVPRESTARHSSQSRRQSDLSQLAGQAKSSVGKFQKSSKACADYGIKIDSRERIVDKEQLSPRRFSQKLESGILESDISGTTNVIDAVKAFEKIERTARGSKSNETFRRSGNCADYNYDESRNSLDLTRTFNSTFLNMTKDSQTSSSYVKGFELGNPVWRGPLSAAYAKSRKEKDRQVEKERQRFNIEEPELVKAVHTEILKPQKMKVELKMTGDLDGPRFVVERVEENFAIKRPHKLPDMGLEPKEDEFSTKQFADVPEVTETAPVTPLSVEIRKLDEDIRRLSFHPNFYTPENITEISPPAPDRIYPNLSKIKFTPTGYTPKKLYQSPCSPEEHGEPFFQKSVKISEELGTSPGNEPEEFSIKNTNKIAKNDKFKPNMESTLKSSLDDLTKPTYSPDRKESTVSSVTIPSNTSKSLEAPGSSSSPKDRNTTLESTIPYDIENFLTDALGDELYNTTMTFPRSDTHDKSISQFNASELISEERTPLQKKTKRFSKKKSSSEPRPQHSGAFNRTASIYRSITRGIKKKLAPGLKSVSKEIINDSTILRDFNNEDKNIQALLREANIQQTLMCQANKALMVCNSRKEFSSSIEQVESERSLLISGLRRSAALEEIQRLDHELNNNDDDDQFCERGEVVVKDFSIPLKEDVLKYESQAGDFVQWFVIAVTHGSSVWATRAVSCPVQSPRIIFNGGFLVPNLSPDFKITVRIFSLKMRRMIFNHEDKYHLNTAEKIATCPSPKKLILGRNEGSLSPKQTKNCIDPSSMKNTSFVLSGMVELYLHDLSLSSPWPLTSLLQGSVLRGTIDLTLSCKLHLSVSHAGFLNDGNEADDHYVVWNRRWCVLQGQTLMFWNYPCDQEDKEPLGVIDLTKCISEKITVVDRKLCAKPRTLSIETIDQTRRTLLCCDTVQDFSQWKTKLNQVITALRDWNVINRLSVANTHLQVSDL